MLKMCSAASAASDETSEAAEATLLQPWEQTMCTELTSAMQCVVSLCSVANGDALAVSMSIEFACQLPAGKALHWVQEACCVRQLSACASAQRTWTQLESVDPADCILVIVVCSAGATGCNT